MKRLLLLATLTILQAQENDIKLHAKMMDKLATDIINKEQTSIYDPTFGRSYVTYLSRSNTVNACSDSDIAIVSSPTQVQGCKNQIVLVTKYNLLNMIPDAVGAFYWQKGRPNLVFIRSRLIEKRVKLASEYTKLIDEQVY